MVEHVQRGLDAGARLAELEIAEGDLTSIDRVADVGEPPGENTSLTRPPRLWSM
jgi:hypothetical protein